MTMAVSWVLHSKQALERWRMSIAVVSEKFAGKCQKNPVSNWLDAAFMAAAVTPRQSIPTSSPGFEWPMERGLQ
jgi:hypothetical protein